MAKYLYNGVELPALPDWDEEIYPNAIIYYTHRGTYVLALLSKMARYAEKRTVTESTGIEREYTDCVYVPDGCSYKTYGHSDGEWYQGVTDDIFSDAVFGYSSMAGDGYEEYWRSVMWTNTDILNTDGSIYLSASDPVPVDPLDPTALLMGWLTGKRIAGMRGKKNEDSGVYDDTFPIEWNTLAVLNNLTITSGDDQYVKVSNLTPTAEEMASTCLSFTFNGNWYDLQYSSGMAFDVGHYAEYAGSYVIVVATAGQSSDFGCTFPEIGIYVFNDGTDGTDSDRVIKIV